MTLCTTTVDLEIHSTGLRVISVSKVTLRQPLMLSMMRLSWVLLAFAVVVVVTAVSAVHVLPRDERHRQVQWYWSRAPSDNLAWLQANGGVATLADGVYTCCNEYHIADNGTFVASFNMTEGIDRVRPYAKAGLKVFPVLAPSMTAVLSGAAQNGVVDAANWAASIGASGFVLDYEPSHNYTDHHIAMYSGFISALAKELSSRLPQGCGVGVDVSSWGIVDAFSSYAAANALFLTSMSSTYFGTNVTRDTENLNEMLAAVDVSILRVGLAAQGGQTGEPGNWTEPALTAWIDQLIADGVSSVDIWTPDTPTSAPTWFLHQLQRFKSMPLR